LFSTGDILFVVTVSSSQRVSLRSSCQQLTFQTFSPQKRQAGSVCIAVLKRAWSRRAAASTNSSDFVKRACAVAAVTK
jgi:hypothetical protein